MKPLIKSHIMSQSVPACILLVFFRGTHAERNACQQKHHMALALSIYKWHFA